MLNGHSGIKETRVCDCVNYMYCDAADIYGLPCIVYTVKVICYLLDSLRVNCKRLTIWRRSETRHGPLDI